LCDADHPRPWQVSSISAYANLWLTLCTPGSSLTSLWLSSLVGRRQGKWLAAIQTRLNTTSVMLGSIKGIKMIGLTDLLSSVITKLRVEEIQSSIQYRGLIVNSIVLCMLSSEVTFLLIWTNADLYSAEVTNTLGDTN
jgi:hypothetical protein